MSDDLIAQAHEWADYGRGFSDDRGHMGATIEALVAQLESARADADRLIGRIGRAVRALEECIDHADVIEILWPPDEDVAQR